MKTKYLRKIKKIKNMNIRKTQLENKKQIKNKKIKRWRIIFVVCSLSFVAHATQNNETD
jgi:hypothetical protein